VGFPGLQSIARLRRRVRRKGKKTTEIIYLISSLTPEELDAAGFLKLKRVHNPKAAFALSMVRRAAVSFAQA
jgi:hypothetical protein